MNICPMLKMQGHFPDAPSGRMTNGHRQLTGRQVQGRHLKGWSITNGHRQMQGRQVQGMLRYYFSESGIKKKTK